MKRKPTSLMQREKHKPRVPTAYEMQCLTRCALLGYPGPQLALTRVHIAPIIKVGK